MNSADTNAPPPNTPAEPETADLSALVVPLLKGVIYRDGDASQWRALLDLQARVRDYVAVLGLELIFESVRMRPGKPTWFG